MVESVYVSVLTKVGFVIFSRNLTRNQLEHFGTICVPIQLEYVRRDGTMWFVGIDHWSGRHGNAREGR